VFVPVRDMSVRHTDPLAIWRAFAQMLGSLVAIVVCSSEGERPADVGKRTLTSIPGDTASCVRPATRVA